MTQFIDAHMRHRARIDWQHTKHFLTQRDQFLPRVLSFDACNPAEGSSIGIWDG